MNQNPHFEKIKAALAAAGLTQTEAAKEIGITPQAFHYGITGRRSPRVREYVTRKLGLPESELWPPPKKRGVKPKHTTD